MVQLRLVLAAAAVVLGVALYGIRHNVASIQRSRPEGVGFAMSHTKGVGSTALVKQRWTTTKEGLPKTVLRVWLPAHDTLKGAYKGHPSSPPEHSHLYQSSKFTATRGQVAYVLDGKEGLLTAGQSVTLPPHHPHTFWNAKPAEEVEIQEEIVTHTGNSTDFASALETLFGLSRDFGGLDNVNPLQLLLTFQEGAHAELTVPAPVRWLIRNVACPLAKLLGYKAVYPEYRSREG